MATGLDYQEFAFIRYPRGSAVGVPVKEEAEKHCLLGKPEQPIGDIEIWAIGNMMAEAEKLSASLSEHGISAGVVNARFVKPLDTEMLLESAAAAKLIVTLEDHGTRRWLW